MESSSANQHVLSLVLIAALVLLLIYSVVYIAINRYQTKQHKSNESLIYLQRLTGVFTFGVLPVAIIYNALPTNLPAYGTSLVMPLRSALWLLVLVVVIIPLNLFQAKKEENLKSYPQIRVKNWNARILVFSAITWTLYLLAYEFFFRGFLLFALDEVAGPYWAVAVNTLLYALAHVPKGKFETMGAIPLGILLCVITFNTGSFWVAFGMHVVMALSNEWFSLYYHKQMRFTLISDHNR